MMTLRCRDVGFDCAGEIRAESVEAVLQQAARHVIEVHGYSEADVTPEFVAAVRARINDENDAATKRQE